MKLLLADSIMLATARAYEATLWTQDAHFKDTADVRYIEKAQQFPEPPSQQRRAADRLNYDNHHQKTS